MTFQGRVYVQEQNVRKTPEAQAEGLKRKKYVKQPPQQAPKNYLIHRGRTTKGSYSKEARPYSIYAPFGTTHRDKTIDNLQFDMRALMENSSGYMIYIYGATSATPVDSPSLCLSIASTCAELLKQCGY